MQSAFLDFNTLGPEDINVNKLRDELPDIKLYSATTPDQVIERIQNVEVIVVNKVPLNSAALLKAEKLKLICVAATGCDNIDLAAAKTHGITVCNIRNYCTASVVQQVFSYILDLTQRTGAWQDLIAKGEWQQSEQFCMLNLSSRELHSKTLGIVGAGALGRAVANVGEAFGMRVIAAELPGRKSDDSFIPRVPWAKFLAQADIVSLHCPLTDSTRNLIDAEALDKMPDDSLLINTSRGGLVDSRALMDALKAGEIGGAGIDVLPVEPPVDGDPLLEKRLSNLLITPHIAWAAIESRQRTVNEIVANIRAYKKGEPTNRLA